MAILQIAELLFDLKAIIKKYFDDSYIILN